jgi:hypothetical protein
MTILQDPVRPFDPSLQSVEPKTTFELASRGGYVRTVTGTIAYLDEEADTYMVLADGELLRVPLRDITSRHEATQEPTLRSRLPLDW